MVNILPTACFSIASNEKAGLNGGCEKNGYCKNRVVSVNFGLWHKACWPDGALLNRMGDRKPN
jgi:hypothetical protein